MKKFAVFDIDGTLIRWQLYHAIVNRLAAKGVFGLEPSQQIKEARRRWKGRSLPFSEYEKVLVQRFLAALPKLDPDDYHQVVDDIWREYHDQTYIFSRELIAELRADNYYLLIISGSPSEIIEKVADHYGFADFKACVFIRNKDGRFSGQLDTPVHDKSLALRQLVVKHGLAWKDSVAIGDSGSDIAVLEAVEKPIAFNPDEKLFKAARANAWPIVVERKDVVYQLRPRQPDCESSTHRRPDCKLRACSDDFTEKPDCKLGACSNGEDNGRQNIHGEQKTRIQSKQTRNQNNKKAKSSYELV
jgi:HAD superfamily hydrolase (TIGR01490 family)